jgi:hypothetical protein
MPRTARAEEMPNAARDAPEAEATVAEGELLATLTGAVYAGAVYVAAAWVLESSVRPNSQLKAAGDLRGLSGGSTTAGRTGSSQARGVVARDCNL